MVGVAPVSGGSDAGVTASLAGHAPPMVAPVPSVGQVDVGILGVPSKAVEQPVMVAIPLPAVRRIGLLTALVALTMAGGTQSVMTLPMQVEVVASMTDGS